MEAVLVDGAIPRLTSGGVNPISVAIAVFIGKDHDVLVAVEIVQVVVLVREGEEEVLQLGKGEQDWCLDNLDAEPVEGRVVEVDGVLQRELAVFVGAVDACVLDYVDGLWSPAGCYVRDDGLKGNGP